jgi:lysophospholipase L1-like esterase
VSFARRVTSRSTRPPVEETGQCPPLTYAALGASDVVGVGADDPVREAWVALISQRLPSGTRFLRLGMEGALARHALTRQVPRAEAARPQLATVWLGVNDFNERVALESYARHLRRILVRLNRAGARVFAGNLPDLTAVPAFAGIPSGTLLERLGTWNRRIAEIAGATGARVVDLMAASGGVETGTLVAADGFHPSTLGHRVLAEVFWAAISADSTFQSLICP